jgi:hypothetical protein
VVILKLDKQIRIRLQQLTGTVCYQFLGFTLNLEEDTIIDSFDSSSQELTEELAVKLIVPMFKHYTMGNPIPLVGRFVKFRDLPGGCAYEVAFVNRAVKPLEQVFGADPELFFQAAKLLGGKRLNLGSDVSVEIMMLKGIPLTFILYVSDEFGAAANILYDESAASFLPTEDLAVLGELTTLRLIEAKQKGLKKYDV